MPTNTKKQSTLVQSGFDPEKGSATGSAASSTTGHPNVTQAASNTVSPSATPNNTNPRTRSSQRKHQGQAVRASLGYPSKDQADKPSSPSRTGSKRCNNRKGSKGKSKSRSQGSKHTQPPRKEPTDEEGSQPSDLSSHSASVIQTKDQDPTPKAGKK